MELGSVSPVSVLVAALGVFVALVGVMTLVGMPWRYASGGALLAVLRIAGSLLAIGGGGALAWLSLRE
ncbi:MAG: hypothetical protein ACQETI_06975 [Halobacteriota archaeon]